MLLPSLADPAPLGKIEASCTANPTIVRKKRVENIDAAPVFGHPFKSFSIYASFFHNLPLSLRLEQTEGILLFSEATDNSIRSMKSCIIKPWGHPKGVVT